MQIPSTPVYQNPTPTVAKSGQAAGSRETAPASADLAAPGTPVTAQGLDSQGSASIHKAMDALPAVRPEVVARGKALFSDPTYPPLEIIDKLANLFVSDARGGAAPTN